MRGWIATLSLATLAGCRPAADSGLLRPDAWGAGWHATIGGSTSGGSFTLHRRPRVGPTARTYFVFIDRRCRLVPGTVELSPWRARERWGELSPSARASREVRFRRYAIPSETLEISAWQVHDVGGYAVVPAGTWQVTARHSIQQSPFAAARAREWDVDVRVDLHARADEDVALLFERIVPPPERASSGAKYRRSRRMSRRCFAGSDMTPRFEVDPEWVARCATTTVEDAAQATSCDALSRATLR